MFYSNGSGYSLVVMNGYYVFMGGLGNMGK